jgi:hypothetical protein
VVHVIDSLLLPFYTTVPEALKAEGLTVVQKATQTAGLTNLIDEQGSSVTVFAPSDEVSDIPPAYILLTFRLSKSFQSLGRVAFIS